MCVSWGERALELASWDDHRVAVLHDVGVDVLDWNFFLLAINHSLGLDAAAGPALAEATGHGEHLENGRVAPDLHPPLRLDEPGDVDRLGLRHDDDVAI